MKILKTLAVLFVLLALTVGAVAEEFTPFGIGEVEFEFPRGLAATVKQTVPGHIDVVVDSAATDWATVVAQLDHWGEIPFFANSTDDSKKGLGNLFNTYEGEVTDWSYDKMSPLYEMGFGLLENDIKGGRSLSLGGVNNLMDYSVSTNTVVPRTYSKESGQWLYLLEAHCDDTRKITDRKYCVISITYTNPSARKVGLNTVPVSRIVESTEAVAKVEAGSVVYELENGHGEYGKNIITGVVPPAGANSFVSNDYNKSQGAAGEKQEIPIWAGTHDSFNAQPVTFFWYAGEPDPETGAPTGKYLGAERIDVSVYVGGAKPWPSYISEDEAEAVSGGDLVFDIWNGAKGQKADFAALTYNGGIMNVARNTSKTMPNDDLTEYVLRQTIKAPAGAAYYAYSDYAYAKSSFLGTSYASYGFENVKEELAEPDNMLAVTGNEIVFEDDLFRKATYSGDAGLETYYDWNSTDDDCGDIIFVQWYDSDRNVIGLPQWYVIRYDTMATTVEKAIESDIPADADEPVLVTTSEVDGYAFKITSYPQYSENGTQIHYELEVLDENGIYTEMDSLPKGEYKLFIPFPDNVENIDELTFTVNHYNANGTKVVESANEKGSAKIILERNEENTGVYMTVTSLSPFVLSWEEVECEHEKENLFYERHENMIRESCKACENHTAVWHIWADKSCVAGTELVYEAGHSEGWLGGDWEITFVHPDAMETFDKTPTEPGEYELVVTFANEKISMLRIPFTVTAAPAMPTTGDNSLPLATLMGMLALALTGAFMLRRKVNG